MADITKITDGRKWRRASWGPGAWVHAVGLSFYDSSCSLYAIGPHEINATDWELLEEDKPERIEITDIRQLAEVNRVEIGTAVHQKSDHKWPASKIEIFLSCLANGIKVEGWVE